MAEIRFSFNAEKLVHALAFFSRRGVPNLTKLKAAKLLYYADKEHLLKHGRPILGDVYFCLRYGPVPSVALNEMTDAIQRPEVDDADVRQDRDAFSQVVRVHKRLLGGNPVFQAKAFDPEVFSESELQALGEVTTCYGRFTAAQLVDLTHKEPTWTIPNQHRTPEGRAPIPYELFFVGAPEESQRILEVLRAEQEDMRELDDILSTRRSASAL